MNSFFEIFVVILLAFSAYAVISNENQNFGIRLPHQYRDLPKEVTVYYLEDQYKEVLGDPPSPYSSSYQIPTAGLVSPTFSTSSSGIEVSSTGLIKAKGTTYYYKGGYGYPYPIEGYQYTRVKYSPVNTTVKVVSEGKTQEIRVYSKSYANIYAENKKNRIINEVIRDNMTKFEKLYAVTQWLALNTNYSGSYWDALDMLIFDRGDCWASTYTIMEFCKKLGLYCRERRANLDIGTGSGHRNVLSIIDGKYYVADAGFSGKKPRKFRVEEEPGAFSSGESTSGIYLIYQYDGEEKEVTIPCQHKNYNNITGLGLGDNSVFIYGTIEKLNIPACITNISGGAFSLCTNLTRVTINSANPNYETDNNGMVYSKGKSTLMFTPTNKKSVSIDPVTTAIGTSGLGNLKLDKLVIPGTVKTLGTSALAFSKITNLTIEYGVETIKNHAFEGMTSTSKVVIPDSVTFLGDYAFNQSRVSSVVLPQGLTEIPKYCFASSSVSSVVIPDTVTIIRKQAFFHCSSFRNISLPASLKTVESDAFFIMSSLLSRDIYFAGSEKRWNRITFETALPSDITVHFGNYPDDPSSEDDSNELNSMSLNSASLISGGFLVWVAIFITFISQIIRY